MKVPLSGPAPYNTLGYVSGIGRGDLLALTVDDGVSSDVVRLYTEFAKDTGVRLTYFVNGTYRSWSDNAPLLRPLANLGREIYESCLEFSGCLG